MSDLNHYVSIYKEQVAKGDIQKAYTGIVKYVTRLGTNLSNKLSERYSFGGLLQGYMDYTYVYYTNDYLKQRKLKMGLVLNHTEMRFEVWLLGQTAPVQQKYWHYFKDTKWNEGRTEMPKYSILETVIVASPDFNDLDGLSEEIEARLLEVSGKIIEDIKKTD